MKKNRMMRLASILLVCVLLTTSVISGTFAKYVSKIEDKDEARVAYWGFGVDAEIVLDDLFVDVYQNPAKDANTVDSKDDDDVIAPGTANFKTFKFAYTNNNGETAIAPEVAYNFTVSTGSSSAVNIEDNLNIQWAILPVAGTAALPAADSDEWGTWDEMIEELQGMDGTDGVGGTYYAPNTAPAKFVQGTEYIIAWQWIFQSEDDPATTDKNEMNIQDKLDTDMGNLQDLDDVVVEIIITAEQVD